MPYMVNNKVTVEGVRCTPRDRSWARAVRLELHAYRMQQNYTQNLSSGVESKIKVSYHISGTLGADFNLGVWQIFLLLPN